MRAEYSKRRDALVESLAAHAPHIRITGLAAGFHAVVHLPDGTDEQDLTARAAALGVGIYGMSGYRSTHDTVPPQLVIGFGNTGSRAIHAGVRAIAGLLGGDG
jgi:GntR family transcriptional regulator / MocR family aminotransferase